MEKEILQSKEFALEMRKSIEGVMTLLIQKGQPFSVVSKSESVTLSPRLDYIYEQYPDFMRFDLVEYSFETSIVSSDNLVFRAGFGSGKNVVETEVTIPLHKIFQITLGTAPILINFSEFSGDIEAEKSDRSQLFKSKNRNLFKGD